MKAIKKLTAILSCIAVAGSLVSTAAFAEGEPTLHELTIEDIAVATGYKSDQDKDNYDTYSSQYDYSRIRLGGDYEKGVLTSVDTQKYQIADGGSAIVYNQLDDGSTNKDTNVCFLRITLPKTVEEADTYKLTMKTDGLVTSIRPGAMDIYAGIADMEHTVRSEGTPQEENWTEINWKNRPVVSNVQSVATAVDITTKHNPVSLELTDVLLGQTGTVTIALLSKANGSTKADSYFKDVKIETSAVADTPEEPTVTLTDKNLATGTDGTAVYFYATVNVPEGASYNTVNVEVNGVARTKKSGTVVASGAVTYGIVVTGAALNDDIKVSVSTVK